MSQQGVSQSKPITPLVGCDVFVVNENLEVLLIKRSDNATWALPGGCHDLGETPKECAERECLEESGYKVAVTNLIGVYSSNRYQYINYPWPENQFCHILFRAVVVGGSAKISSETLEVGWFKETEIPELCDGHDPRIRQGFQSLHNHKTQPYFE
jgi:ADP-ribose pyrophosphatase YjhB (NUDIX family)